MSDRIPKVVLFSGAGLAALLLAFAAVSRPWYFTSQTYLGGLILLEFLLAAVWLYRRVFFPVIILAFLLAGVNIPVGTVWTGARWLFLAVGAVAGVLIVLKDRRHHYGLFHAIASFAILTSLVSATVSRYPNVALLKVLSIFLLFVYGGTGARVAVSGRENRFFAGLILGCEVFVGVIAALQVVGIGAMGNPNSLGAVMGIAGAPILLWGALIASEPSVRHRRGVLFAVCMYLGFASHSRAGLAAAFCSCALLCLALRKYKMFIEGLIVLVIVLAGTAIVQPEFIAATTSSVLYKGSREQGILASRETPWHVAMNNISEHPWFGTGLGTTADGADPTVEQAKFSSSTSVTTENGSSYLSILAGVGVVGTIPFAMLLLLLFGRVVRTVKFMRNTGVAAHAAVPLAMVIVGGTVHAFLEDWMFAGGNYLCVFFWSVAFILVDVTAFPSFTLASGYAVRWSHRDVPHTVPEPLSAR
jgi:O-antigen ligase